MVAGRITPEGLETVRSVGDSPCMDRASDVAPPSVDRATNPPEVHAQFCIVPAFPAPDEIVKPSGLTEVIVLVNVEFPIVSLVLEYVQFAPT